MALGVTRRLVLQSVTPLLSSGGTTSGGLDAKAIQAQVDWQSRRGGGEVIIPPGTAVFDEPLIVRPGVVVRGGGMGRTILRAAKTGMPVIDIHGRGPALGVGGVEDLTVWGWGDRVPQVGSESDRAVRIGPFTDGHCLRVEVAWSRYISLTPYGTNFKVDGCYVHHGFRDGINANSVDHVVIANNRVEYVADDGISCHVGANITGKIDRSLKIVNNSLHKCTGIKALGARNALIDGNTLNVVYGYAIYLGADPHFHEGEIPEHNIRVTNNAINDVIGLRAVSNQDGVAAIYVRNFPVDWNADVADIDMVNHSGRLGPSIGVIIESNSIKQNLEQAGLASAVGLGELWWTQGFLDPLLPSDISLKGAFTMRGIMIQGGAWRGLEVNGNEISGLLNGVYLLQIDQLKSSKIYRNIISRCEDGIIVAMTKPADPDLLISENAIDLDPRGEVAGHGPGGVWAAKGPRCAGIVFQNVINPNQMNNSFYNLRAPVVAG